MDKVKVYYNNESDTMDIWFGNPEDEVVCEEAGEGIILKKDKNGKTYLTLSIDGVGRFVCWANKFKETDQQPDFRVFESRPYKPTTVKAAPVDDVIDKVPINEVSL